MVKHIFFILLMIAGGYYFWNTRPVVHGPGEVTPNEPLQEQAYGVKKIDFKDLKLSPFAKIDLEARVLSKKKYYEDREATFAPYDIVLGWGPMSDERNLEQILIKQSDRYYYWEMIQPSIGIQEIRTHTANIRFITPDKEISDRLANLRIGQVIQVKGYLVDVKSTQGWTIKSSSKRTDSGKEGTEIIWINDFNIM
ncbi:hypothetical protein G3570_07495 [Balneolaceae bacterium YR4-1]|uniref:Uncharacterized protein n=1 Tax=Halalkalibaculum roseum TaxID=2709311 RepID=A0A6M1SMB0_9BACT|nr:hypothetical protein [Halalkalibaculum roseum]NGP76471.1 hypothetical protein [Halalkalibaculum roseum]